VNPRPVPWLLLAVALCTAGCAPALVVYIHAPPTEPREARIEEQPEPPSPPLQDDGGRPIFTDPGWEDR
jgi:hypothetical protein